MSRFLEDVCFKKQALRAILLFVLVTKITSAPLTEAPKEQTSKNLLYQGERLLLEYFPLNKVYLLAGLQNIDPSNVTPETSLYLRRLLLISHNQEILFEASPRAEDRTFPLNHDSGASTKIFPLASLKVSRERGYSTFALIFKSAIETYKIEGEGQGASISLLHRTPFSPEGEYPRIPNMIYAFVSPNSSTLWMVYGQKTESFLLYSVDLSQETPQIKKEKVNKEVLLGADAFSRLSDDQYWAFGQVNGKEEIAILTIQEQYPRMVFFDYKNKKTTFSKNFGDRFFYPDKQKGLHQDVLSPDIFYFFHNTKVIKLDLKKDPSKVSMTGEYLLANSNKVIAGIKDLPETSVLYLILSSQYTASSGGLPVGPPIGPAMRLLQVLSPPEPTTIMMGINKADIKYNIIAPTRLLSRASSQKSARILAPTSAPPSSFLNGLSTQNTAQPSGFACCHREGDKQFLMASDFSQKADQASHMKSYWFDNYDKCQLSNCLQCSQDLKTCEICGLNYRLEEGRCSVEENAGQQTCLVKGCAACPNPTSPLCDKCHFGLSLRNPSTCVFEALFEIKFSETTPKDANFDLTYIFTIKDASFLNLTQEDHSVYAKELIPAWTKIEVLQGNKPLSEGTLKATPIRENTFRVGIHLTTELEEDPTTVRFTFSPGVEKPLSQGFLHAAQQDTQSLSYPSDMLGRPSTIKKFEKTGKIMSTIAGASDHPAIGTTVTVLMAVEPTGTLIKFAQILKIVNKMRLFNLNFGHYLQAFLDNIGDLFYIGGNKDKDVDVRHSKGFRGKMSNPYVDMQFYSIFPIKIWIYLASWIILLANFIVKELRVEVKKLYIHVIYWHNKFHLILFSIFSIDFIFFGIRSLLHTRRGLMKDVILSYLCVLLATIDFCLLLWCVTDLEAWKRAFKIKIKTLQTKTKAERNKLEAQKRIKKEGNSNLDGTQAELKDQSHLQTEMTAEPEKEKSTVPSRDREVDYETTYKCLTYSALGAEFLSTPLMPSNKALNDNWSKLELWIHLSRVCIYQVTVVSCQFLSGILILGLLILELARVKHASNTFFRTKHVRLFHMVATVAQSIFLALFLILSFLLHFNDFSEPVSQGNQRLGMMIVMVAVFFEWILTLISLIFYTLIPLFRRKSKSAKKELQDAKRYIFYMDERPAKIINDQDENQFAKMKQPIRSKRNSETSVPHLKPLPSNQSKIEAENMKPYPQVLSTIEKPPALSIDEDSLNRDVSEEKRDFNPLALSAKARRLKRMRDKSINQNRV